MSTSRSTIYRDRRYVLFCANVGLVLVGYAAAVATGGDPIPAIQWAKYILLVLSMAEIQHKLFSAPVYPYHVTQAAHFFCFLLLFSALGADPESTASRASAFILPFLYVLHLLVYFFTAYEPHQILTALLRLFQLVYSAPVIVYFLITQRLHDTNIYHIATENPYSLFVSNHYGWAGIFSAAAGLDLIRNTRMSALRTTLTIATIVAGVYLVLVSGSRSSLLCLFLVLLILGLRNRSVPVAGKIASVLIVSLLSFNLWHDRSSALYTRFGKTLHQIEQGEPRQQIAAKMFTYFNHNPGYYLKGFGSFNKQQIAQVTGTDTLHNSYLDVLFGAGLPAFLLFLFFMVIRPVWYYATSFSRRYLCLPPLIIIPFFESNLTGGQFLFFPWITLTLFFSYLPPLLKDQYVCDTK